MVTLSFRIRRVYFDQIIGGTKTREVRRLDEYWRKRAAKVIEDKARGGEAVAVFVCGKDVHRREIVGVGWKDTAAEALGREPSEQGRKDIGDGPVVYFELGEVI